MPFDMMTPILSSWQNGASCLNKAFLSQHCLYNVLLRQGSFVSGKKRRYCHNVWLLSAKTMLMTENKEEVGVCLWLSSVPAETSKTIFRHVTLHCLVLATPFTLYSSLYLYMKKYGIRNNTVANKRKTENSICLLSHSLVWTMDPLLYIHKPSLDEMLPYFLHLLLHLQMLMTNAQLIGCLKSSTNF